MPNHSALKYHNLDFFIDRRNDGQYTVRATSSVCGEEKPTTIKFPYNHAELMQRANLVFHLIWEMQQGNSSGEEEIISQFGRELFESLISDKFNVLYERCLQQSSSTKNTGLRLRLRISDPELATIPWEYLYDPGRRKFLASFHNSPIVRYMDLQQSTTTPATVKLPLKLLCVISTPTDLAPLGAAQEKKVLEGALAPLVKEGKVDVRWFDSCTTYDNLQAIMRDEVWHIFHFIGHGGFDPRREQGYICLTNELGEAQIINASQLTPLLEHQRPTLKLVLLNTCEGAKANHEDMLSSLVGVLMANGVLSVIAMQQKITSRAAKVFSQNFYSSIAAGLPIDASISTARASMHADTRNKLEWGIPTLYMRASDGVIFKLSNRSQRSDTTPSNRSNASKQKGSSERNGTTREQRNRTKDRTSVQTLNRNESKSYSYKYKKSLPNTHSKATLDYIDKLIILLMSPVLGDFVRSNIDAKKLQRYYKGLPSLGFFFFLCCDVLLASLGVLYWLHSPVLALLTLCFLLSIFFWNSINQNILISILFSLLFGVLWYSLSTHYFPSIALIIHMIFSVIFSYIRFHLFKPVKRRNQFQ